MSASKEHSKVEEAEQNLKIIQIQSIFDKITSNITFTEGRHIVAFVGPTKAGKSTLINCLMNNSLICKKDPRTEETHIVSATAGQGPVIGVSGESETFIPKGYTNIPDTDWPMWDFPGFGDNKGTEQEIANAAAYEKVLRPQKSVRFVLVVPIDLIKSDNPMQFFKLLSDIVMICPNVAESFCIVATKSEKGTISAWLEKAESAPFNHANKENSKIVADAKRVIQSVLKNNRCIDFKAPVMNDDILEQSFSPPNLQQIITLIKNLKGTAVSDFPLVISDQAKHEILLLYTVFYQTLRKEIENVCQNFDHFVQQRIHDILQSSDDDGKPTTSSARLALFRQGKNKITLIIERGTDFKKFFEEVKQNGFHVEKLAESVEKFIFIERIQNMYKTKDRRDTRGEHQFFTRIQIAMNSAGQKYSDLIRNSEVATAEEKRLENEWKAAKEKEKEILTKQVREMEKENESLIVRGAKYIANSEAYKAAEKGVTYVVEAVKNDCSLQ